MATNIWQELRLSSGDTETVWELFHENSKTTRYDVPPSDEEVLAIMATRWEALPFEGLPLVRLPTELTPLRLSLGEAIVGRVTARSMAPVDVSLKDVATLLRYAYGITRPNVGTEFPRPFRTVPSGGALYPLELFFYSARVEGLPTGVYHYNPAIHVLRQVRDGEAAALIASALVQPEIVDRCSLMLFITAMFERSTFKYGDRGYRFALLEAGHVAQNTNLVAGGLGLGCINLGGYFDRDVDAFLDLDGLTHSTVYLIAVGQEGVRERIDGPS
jgi:SagB-type dehydrogenase family enzyme